MPLPSLRQSVNQAMLPRDSWSISGPSNPTSLGSHIYLAPSYTGLQLACVTRAEVAAYHFQDQEMGWIAFVLSFLPVTGEPAAMALKGL